MHKYCRFPLELDPLFEELLPVVEKNVPHDPEWLYTGGMSGGASRALHYTAKFDRPWKGVWPVVAGIDERVEPDFEFSPN